MKTRFSIMIIVCIITAATIGFFAFETTAAEFLCKEKGGVISGNLCIMENQVQKIPEDLEIKEIPLEKISFMKPNSMEFFYYPNPEDTKNRDEFQKFILIRLPEYLGGATNDVLAFRAYSAISISTDHCISKYWPEPGRQRIEDPCWGTMYRAIDGLVIQNTDPVLITSPMALPYLDLSIDDSGFLYVEPPKWTLDENGVVGVGRSISLQEIRQGSQIIADSHNRSNPNQPPISVEFAGFLLTEIYSDNDVTEARYYDFSSMGNNYIQLSIDNVSAQDQKYFLNFAKPDTEFWKIGETIIQIGGSAFDSNNDLPERYKGYGIQFIQDGFKFTISGNNLENLKKSIIANFFPDHSYEDMILISSTVKK